MNQRTTTVAAMIYPSRMRKRKGFALESVLMLMVMFSVIILAGLSAVTSLTRSSNADYSASR